MCPIWPHRPDSTPMITSRASCQPGSLISKLPFLAKSARRILQDVAWEPEHKEVFTSKSERTGILVLTSQCSNCVSREDSSSMNSNASFGYKVSFETTKAWPPTIPCPAPRVAPALRVTPNFPAMPSVSQSAKNEGQCRANIASPRSQKRRRTSASRKLSTSLGEIAVSACLEDRLLAAPPSAGAEALPAAPQIQLAMRSSASIKLGLSTTTPPCMSTSGWLPCPAITSMAMHVRPS
mmetsp:Transcript_116737/g.337190  ORF Transcript_116737/g.337190 Transcript_116737/m.337190 type:complete len:237 (+) Transcript_116737:2776-3486(+)